MLFDPLVVRIPPSMQMTDDQFFEFCQINSDLRIERNKFRELSIMPPTGSETGNRENNPWAVVGLVRTRSYRSNF